MSTLLPDHSRIAPSGSRPAINPRRLRGRYLDLPLQRRWMGDLLAACQRTPVVGGELAMRLGPALAARRALSSPPSWIAIILKAYAIVALRRPELRRMYMTFPSHRLYEHPCSVATVVVEREMAGEMGLFFHQIFAPETLPLPAIDKVIDDLRTKPIERSRDVQRMMRISRWPRLLRRLLWWYGLSVSGRTRARYFGTFSINALLRSRRWNLMQSLSPITMALSHAALEPPAQIRIWGVFDHRVFDGMPMSRALADLESVINNEIAAELRGLA